MLRSPLRFSRDSYQNLVRRIDRSDPHPTLIGGEKWYPPDEQVQQDAKADAELAATGWPVRDFADVIGLLQRPSVDRYCWARINGRDVTLQAAAARRDAILAVADHDTITLFPSTAESAARELVSALPGTPPASNLHSLSCSEADYSAVLAGNPPPTRTNSARDARRAVEWMQAPRIHVGRLYVAIRRGTERVRNEHPPYWIDTEQGRFTAAVTDGWLSISPAGADDLARMLHTIEAGLRA
ncbi:MULTISPECIES: ESX secretion-associated protein EspG [unclassified Amycolatopsis]|uniref:ESX secretion-associated protein EspG n=1 Tax=unclassified Amycolatopsis TaxID=2618356 RepID=UPI001430A924|nr:MULTISPECIES: ESX secretion-associated protein EspG [unclassified Amycolatopsis]